MILLAIKCGIVLNSILLLTSLLLISEGVFAVKPVLQYTYSSSIQHQTINTQGTRWTVFVFILLAYSELLCVWLYHLKDASICSFFVHIHKFMAWGELSLTEISFEYECKVKRVFNRLSCSITIYRLCDINHVTY